MTESGENKNILNDKENRKAQTQGFAYPNKKIGVTGFEPATSTSRT